jgi:very-short-patch-repair endonuclease
MSDRQHILPYLYQGLNRNREDYWVSATCPNCNVEFEHKISEKTRKFCSYICAMQYRFRNLDKKSIPEIYVEELLNKYSISYISQYELNNRFFDFYLVDLNYLIEIDGTYHHAKNIDNFYDMDRIQKRTRYNDIIKNKIAEQNNIPLLRIWHDEIYKLKDILEETCT